MFSIYWVFYTFYRIRETYLKLALFCRFADKISIKLTFAFN
jgi:hypothetical protein